MFYGWVKSCRLPVGHNEKRVHIAIYGNMHASIAGGDFYLTPGIRRGEMERHPVILSIAGSDCSGGAGIQADIKTISALGGYAASAITAITVQNTLGVRAVQSISPDMVRGQIEAVMDDLQPVAIKIGMINDIQIVRVISDCLQKYSPAYVVYDPVMVSTSGKKLMTDRKSTRLNSSH